MADNEFLTNLSKFAQSLGFKVVIDDASGGNNSLPSSLIFVQGIDGAVYSISVERVA